MLLGCREYICRREWSAVTGCQLRIEEDNVEKSVVNSKV